MEQNLHFPSKIEIFFGLVVGIIFIAFSFPIGLAKLGNALGWSLIQDLGVTAKTILNTLFGSTLITQFSSYHNLWLALIVGLLLYILALTILSLRHQRFDLFGSGFLSLIIGTVILNLLAWVVFIAVIIIIFIFTVLGWIFQILGFLFSKLEVFLGFIIGMVGRFFMFIFGSAWWLIAIPLLIVVGYLAIRHPKMLGRVILWVLGVCGIVGVLYLLIKFFQFLVPLLRSKFAPIGQILGVLLHYIVIILLGFFVGFVIYGLGAWVIDLFRGAWKAGNNRFGVIIGSLSVGTALALILLETNLYNLVRFPLYPPQFVSFATIYLHASSPPFFDMIMALMVLGISIIGVLRNLPELQEEPTVGEFQSAMFMAGVGVIIGGALIAVSGQTEHN